MKSNGKAVNKVPRILTGITASGLPHLGNYIGAIRPALAAQDTAAECFYFIADGHSLVKLRQASERLLYVREIAAAFLAFGLNPEKTVFYRQSQVPEIFELFWILTSIAPKGLLNRAHAYKDQVSKNEQEGHDPDEGIDMGLYCYPALMAADILAFQADIVPVGKDQVQHLEITRDLAARFNHLYGQTFSLPKVQIEEQSAILPGLDGRKMSKSYGNTLPLFLESKALHKLVMKMVTNSQGKDEPKNPDESAIFQVYRAFATAAQTAEFADQYRRGGLGWGDAKNQLFEVLEQALSEPRQRYQALMAEPAQIDAILQVGSERARSVAQGVLKQVKQAVGL